MPQTHDLESEVENLKSVLEEEQAIHKVLYSAVNGTVSPHPCLSTFLPPQIQGLLEELANVEEEITWLERKVDELKLNLYHERKRKRKLHKKHQRIQRQLPPLSRLANASVVTEDFSYQQTKSQHCQDMRKQKLKFRRASVRTAQGISYILSTGSTSRILFSPSKDSSL